MVMKPTKAYKRLRISYVIYILCLLHVSATLVTIVRDVHYKVHIIKVLKQCTNVRLFQKFFTISFVVHIPEDNIII